MYRHIYACIDEKFIFRKNSEKNQRILSNLEEFLIVLDKKKIKIKLILEISGEIAGI